MLQFRCGLTVTVESRTMGHRRVQVQGRGGGYCQNLSDDIPGHGGGQQTPQSAAECSIRKTVDGLRQRRHAGFASVGLDSRICGFTRHRVAESRLCSGSVAALAGFLSGILTTNRLDGWTYVLPWYVDTRLLFYRSDLLVHHRLCPANGDLGELENGDGRTQGSQRATRLPSAIGQRVATAGRSRATTRSAMLAPT